MPNPAELARDLVDELRTNCDCGVPYFTRDGEWAVYCPPGCSESDRSKAVRRGEAWASEAMGPVTSYFWHRLKQLYGYAEYLFGDPDVGERTARGRAAAGLDTAMFEATQILSRQSVDRFGGASFFRKLKGAYRRNRADHVLGMDADQFVLFLLNRWPDAVEQATRARPVEAPLPSDLVDLCSHRAAYSSNRRSCEQLLTHSWRRLILSASSAAAPPLAANAFPYWWRMVQSSARAFLTPDMRFNTVAMASAIRPPRPPTQQRRKEPGGPPSQTSSDSGNNNMFLLGAAALLGAVWWRRRR